MIRIVFIFGFILLMAQSLKGETPRQPVLLNMDILHEIKVEPIISDPKLGLGIANLTQNHLKHVSYLAHTKYKRCGGFEALELSASELASSEGQALLYSLEKRAQKESHIKNFVSFVAPSDVQEKPDVTKALEQIDASRIALDVAWLSSYETRYHRAPTKNDHVYDFKERLEMWAETSKLPIEIELIEHNRTDQLTVMFRIEGKDRPEETVVLGGHLDSINSGWGSLAPGADDNASGSASLLEALRVLLQQVQPERTIEFFWYAGEESGLLGSAEIAKHYKEQEIDVIGALQLDMTSFPGSGANTFAFITDYTSAWLTQYLDDLNTVYVGAKAKRSKCGYGCSDHASWYRQGFPSAFPHEASFQDSNHNIHTTEDVIENGLDFNHASIFAELALAFAMDLANSTGREPN